MSPFPLQLEKEKFPRAGEFPTGCVPIIYKCLKTTTRRIFVFGLHKSCLKYECDLKISVKVDS